MNDQTTIKNNYPKHLDESLHAKYDVLKIEPTHALCKRVNRELDDKTYASLNKAQRKELRVRLITEILTGSPDITPKPPITNPNPQTPNPRSTGSSELTVESKFKKFIKAVLADDSPYMVFPKTFYVNHFYLRKQMWLGNEIEFIKLYKDMAYRKGNKIFFNQSFQSFAQSKYVASDKVASYFENFEMTIVPDDPSHSHPVEAKIRTIFICEAITHALRQAALQDAFLVVFVDPNNDSLRTRVHELWTQSTQRSSVLQFYVEDDITKFKYCVLDNEMISLYPIYLSLDNYEYTNLRHNWAHFHDIPHYTCGLFVDIQRGEAFTQAATTVIYKDFKIKSTSEEGLVETEIFPRTIMHAGETWPYKFNTAFKEQLDYYTKVDSRSIGFYTMLILSGYKENVSMERIYPWIKSPTQLTGDLKGLHYSESLRYSTFGRICNGIKNMCPERFQDQLESFYIKLFGQKSFTISAFNYVYWAPAVVTLDHKVKGRFSFQNVFTQIADFMEKNREVKAFALLAWRNALPVNGITHSSYQSVIRELLIGTLSHSFINASVDFNLALAVSLNENRELKELLEPYWKFSLVEKDPINFWNITKILPWIMGGLAFAWTYRKLKASVISKLPVAGKIFNFVSSKLAPYTGDYTGVISNVLTETIGIVPEEILFSISNIARPLVASVEFALTGSPYSIAIHAFLAYIEMQYGKRVAFIAHLVHNCLVVTKASLLSNMAFSGILTTIFSITVLLLTFYQFYYCQPVDYQEDEDMGQSLEEVLDLAPEQVKIFETLDPKEITSGSLAMEEFEKTKIFKIATCEVPANYLNPVVLPEEQRMENKSMEIIDLDFVTEQAIEASKKPWAKTIYVALATNVLYNTPAGPLHAYHAIWNRLQRKSVANLLCQCKTHDFIENLSCPQTIRMLPVHLISRSLASMFKQLMGSVDVLSREEYFAQLKNNSKRRLYEQADLELMERDTSARITWTMKNNEVIPWKNGCLKARMFSAAAPETTVYCSDLFFSWQLWMKKMNKHFVDVNSIFKNAVSLTRNKESTTPFAQDYDNIFGVLARPLGMPEMEEIDYIPRKTKFVFVSGFNAKKLSKYFTNMIQDVVHDYELIMGDDSAASVNWTVGPYDNRITYPKYYINMDYTQFESSQNRHWMNVEKLGCKNSFSIGDSTLVERVWREVERIMSAPQYAKMSRDEIVMLTFQIMRSSGLWNTCCGNTWNNKVMKVMLRVTARFHAWEEANVKTFLNYYGWDSSEYKCSRYHEDIRFLSGRVYRNLDGKTYTWAPTITAALTKMPKISTNPNELDRSKLTEQDRFEIVSYHASMYFGNTIPEIPIVKQLVTKLKSFASKKCTDAPVLTEGNQYLNKTLTEDMAINIDYDFQLRILMEKTGFSLESFKELMFDIMQLKGPNHVICSPIFSKIVDLQL